MSQFPQSEPLNIPLMENNITREDLDMLVKFLEGEPLLTNGPQVREFEARWSKWLGVKHSVFVNSGSSANYLTMAVLRERFGEGEIVVPPLAWISDIASVLAAGFKPIFVDINLNNLCMNVEQVLAAVTPRTRAVFLTHVLGFNGLTDELLRELSRRNVALVEDTCEAHGATFRTKKLGTFGLVSNFSFYFAHQIKFCENAPCHVVGGQAVWDTLRDTLNLKNGETTPDNKWTLVTTSSLGLCSVGPVVLINDDLYGNVTPDEIDEILARYE